MTQSQIEKFGQEADEYARREYKRRYPTSICSFDPARSIPDVRDTEFARLVAQGHEAETKRLDFMIEHDACYVYQHPAKAPYETMYQVWEQDEDEGWRIISGDGFFKSPREAIDAAIANERTK